MAVLISTTVKNQTQEGYDGILNAVQESIKKAPGFIMHCAHPADGEWKVYEVWNSKQESDKWFAENVAGNLPPGIHPKRRYQELHSMVTPIESTMNNQ